MTNENWYSFHHKYCSEDFQKSSSFDRHLTPHRNLDKLKKCALRDVKLQRSSSFKVPQNREDAINSVFVTGKPKPNENRPKRPTLEKQRSARNLYSTVELNSSGHKSRRGDLSRRTSLNNVVESTIAVVDENPTISSEALNIGKPELERPDVQTSISSTALDHASGHSISRNKCRRESLTRMASIGTLAQRRNSSQSQNSSATSKSRANAQLDTFDTALSSSIAKREANKTHRPNLEKRVSSRKLKSLMDLNNSGNSARQEKEDLNSKALSKQLRMVDDEAGRRTTEKKSALTEIEHSSWHGTSANASRRECLIRMASVGTLSHNPMPGHKTQPRRISGMPPVERFGEKPQESASNRMPLLSEASTELNTQWESFNTIASSSMHKRDEDKPSRPKLEKRVSSKQVKALMDLKDSEHRLRQKGLLKQASTEIVREKEHQLVSKSTQSLSQAVSNDDEQKLLRPALERSTSSRMKKSSTEESSHHVRNSRRENLSRASSASGSYSSSSQSSFACQSYEEEPSTKTRSLLTLSSDSSSTSDDETSKEHANPKKISKKKFFKKLFARTKTSLFRSVSTTAA